MGAVHYLRPAPPTADELRRLGECVGQALDAGQLPATRAPRLVRYRRGQRWFRAPIERLPGYRPFLGVAWWPTRLQQRLRAFLKKLETRRGR